jgi:hypothetical protein
MDYDSFETLRVAVDEGVAFVTLEHGEINLIDYLRVIYER